MGIPAIPAPGLIPDPPGLARSRAPAVALVVWCNALPPSLYGDLWRQILNLRSFCPKDSGRKVYDRHLANEYVPAIDLYFRA